MKRDLIIKCKEDLKKDLRDYQRYIDNKICSYNRENSFFIRYHRLVLEGSYDGYDFNMVKTQLNKNLNISGYRNYIFRTLNHLIYHEYFNREVRLSPSELNKILLETLNYKGYEQFLNDLLNNIRDFQEYVLNKTIDRTFIYFKYPKYFKITKYSKYIDNE